MKTHASPRALGKPGAPHTTAKPSGARLGWVAALGPVPIKVALAVLALPALLAAAGAPRSRPAASPYPAMAPLREYLMPRPAEIALARSAAPPSISAAAQIMVLTQRGFRTVVPGRNGFVCIVERSWDANLKSAKFWNPKIRGPACYNPAAVKTFLPLILMRARLLLAGDSKPAMARAVTAALAAKQLPPLAPGTMCFMLSPRQFLGDRARRWHPHLMLFVPGRAGHLWAANRAGSPVLASYDPLDRLTVVIIPVSRWSNGAPAPPL